MKLLTSQRRGVLATACWLLVVLLSSTTTQARRTTSSTVAVLAHHKQQQQQSPTTTTTTTAILGEPDVLASRGGAAVTITATNSAAMPAWKVDLLHRAKVGFYFGLWYALNIVYNSK
eukprot:scaffold3677_cov206-Amphora_coffeaeformis.AAC.5